MNESEMKTEDIRTILPIEHEDPSNLIELKELLGQGAYGSVYRAIHKKIGKEVAVKIMAIANTNLDTIRKEISILKECISPYIVEYYGSYLKEMELWVVMEYCDGSGVSDLMKATKETLSEDLIGCIFRQVLKGLEFMHARKKIHRDIKAGNILLNSRGQAKLADFGVCAELVSTISKKTSTAGSPFWMSPEVIKKSEYNKKADIWSLGITAIEMAEGQPPYYQMHYMRAMFVIKSKPARGLTDPESYSPDFQSFVSLCLQVDPKHRPTASELLAHPFILKSKSRKIIAKYVRSNLGALSKYRNEICAGKIPEEIIPDAGTMVCMENGNTSGPIVNEGEDMGNTLVVKEAEEETKEQPGFMKYIMNMDLDRENKDYLQQHFDAGKYNALDLIEKGSTDKENHKGDDKFVIPTEYQGYTPERLKFFLTQLKENMDIEIELIRERYISRIGKLEATISYLQKAENPPTRPEGTLKEPEPLLLDPHEEPHIINKIHEGKIPFFLQQYKNGLLEMPKDKDGTLPHQYQKIVYKK